MSLIISNKQTLDATALILISSDCGKTTIKQNGDFVQVFVGSKLVGVNVLRANQHFDVAEGAHSLTLQQIKVLQDNNVIFDYESHFCVGKVLARKVHPQSDKLFVLEVQTDSKLQIVTNSYNSLVGAHVIVAKVGAILPLGLEIRPTKVLGELSEGMLCSNETLLRPKTDGVAIVENALSGFTL